MQALDDSINKTLSDDEIEALTFEQALKKLENIVQRVDSGQEDLDSAIQSFELAAKLKAHCERKLSNAKLKIDVLVNKTKETAS